MRKITLIILGIIAGLTVNAQNDSIAINLANRVADRLKDSLLLTINERDQIFLVNMNLHRQKKEIRKNYPESPSLQYFLQGVEDQRDSLYHQIILDEEKFRLYIINKKTLVQSN